MATFDRGEYDALYTLLERIFPTLTDPESLRDAEYFMDRCESAIGPLRRQGEKLNHNMFSGVPGAHQS
jgi:hypothetical protein